jgi:high-affinity K+ transport system ATPase subunit B
MKRSNRRYLRSASSVLAALAKRMPSVDHGNHGTDMLDVALVDIAVGDTLVIYPHEICPADGVVTDGHGVMDESYLRVSAIAEDQQGIKRPLPIGRSDLGKGYFVAAIFGA